MISAPKDKIRTCEKELQMNFELTASMMCANYGNLEKEVMGIRNRGN